VFYFCRGSIEKWLCPASLLFQNFLNETGCALAAILND